MKVGDYVRTDKGEIGKVTSVANENLGFGEMEFCNTEPYVYGNIIKSAEGTPKGLLNLIEVGDYVNDYLVDCVGKNGVYIYVPFVDDESIGCDENLIKKEDIKSIVTSQQFEAMEYRIGE